ncbi:MAG: ATP-dependent DNA helicase [Alphaproteobacteria bacterium]|nr:ATP-dependent DNA helicase [Alphaproteobacteria bacterium]
MHAKQRISDAPARLDLPSVPALALAGGQAHMLSPDGEIRSLPRTQAALALHKRAVLVCHAPFVRARLDLENLPAYDVLELFAFVHPARFATPTIPGLCKILDLALPESDEDHPLALNMIAKALLRDLRHDLYKDRADPLKIAAVMGVQGKGWNWTPFIFAALGQVYDPADKADGREALAVWKHLPQWAEEAPAPPPAQHSVSAGETLERLNRLLGPDAEERQAQKDYALAVAHAFETPAETPHMVLAEAGTGIGKTRGYLSPASVWAEKNEGSVWISTYTKNLQRQIDQELNRLYPEPRVREAHVAIRKGRENYACLLNLEDLNNQAALAHHGRQAIAAGIMTRWAAATKDGDLSGSGFPGWLPGLLGAADTAGLGDRRGECIYAACDHYTRCFTEHAVRKSRRARIVVANHAVVMTQAALSIPGDDLPARYVFDEGHHLFDAADSAFAAHLSGREARDLRRWILGAEGGRKTRARGLSRRAEDLCRGHDACEKLLQEILLAAHCLPADGWTQRLKQKVPLREAEQFFVDVHKHVWARAQGRESGYSLEAETHPVDESLTERATALRQALSKIAKPMNQLIVEFQRRLADDTGEIDAETRKRLDSVSRALERRSRMMVQPWMEMLAQLQKGLADPRFVDWMEIERVDGHAVDIGLYRHYIDPMQPFGATLRPHVQGLAVTSASLRDPGIEDLKGWESVMQRTGANYINPEASKAAYESPFDFAAQSRIFIINDVRKDDLAQVAGAYNALFQASGGGALGLFTAIHRLRAVHERIGAKLEESGLNLFAQHVDAIDAGTLVDMFRDDAHACLLGTDAVRDGVDVPGDALRLVVFDRVPWPRPTILHKARRNFFASTEDKRLYDEMITRFKLRQAFGRLIRKADDRGVFVMLDPSLPSRLQRAFPPGAPIVKCGLGEAVAAIKEFLRPSA